METRSETIRKIILTISRPVKRKIPMLKFCHKDGEKVPRREKGG
jgi:hypothetical protein